MYPNSQPPDKELPLYAPIFKTQEEAEAFTWRGLGSWQGWLSVWHHKNFGHVPLSVQAAKLLEEAGELGHAVVRLWLGERRHAEAPEMLRHKADLRDAIGDVVVVVTTIAIAQGWSLADILKEVRAELDAREYNETTTDHD